MLLALSSAYVLWWSILQTIWAYCKQYEPRSDCSLSLILNFSFTTSDSSMKSFAKLTDALDMTIVVDWDIHLLQTNGNFHEV